MDKITAEHLRQALENTYTSPEWYLGFEVGNSTGSSCRRHADAVAVNAYPSKGFEVRGFEIKVSKSDLASELKNGLKSDEIARFCDYWFLVIPKGLADDFTLPPTWGVIEYHDGALRQKKRAEKLEKISPTMGFLCAMLRGRDRLMIKKAHEIAEKDKESIKQSALWGVKNSEKELDELKEKLAEINKQTGIALDNWTPAKYIIERLKTAQSLDIIERNIKGINWSAEALLKNAQEIMSAAEAMHLKTQ